MANTSSKPEELYSSWCVLWKVVSPVIFTSATFEIQAALNLLMATSKVLRANRALVALFRSLAIVCKLVGKDVCLHGCCSRVVSEGAVPRCRGKAFHSELLGLCLGMSSPKLRCTATKVRAKMHRPPLRPLPPRFLTQVFLDRGRGRRSSMTPDQLVVYIYIYIFLKVDVTYSAFVLLHRQPTPPHFFATPLLRSLRTCLRVRSHRGWHETFVAPM